MFLLSRSCSLVRFFTLLFIKPWWAESVRGFQSWFTLVIQDPQKCFHPLTKASPEGFLRLWSVFCSSHQKRGSLFYRGIGAPHNHHSCLGLPLPAVSLELPVERIQAFPDKQTVQEKTNMMASAECSLLCGQLKIFIVVFFFPEKNQPYSAMNQWRFSNMNKWTLNCAIESFKLHYQELYCLNLFKSPICSQATNSLNRQRFCENQWESCRQNSEYHFNHKLYTWWILSHDHNRGPQKYSILVAFISFLCATSSVGDQEGNISYKPLGSGKQATFLLMHLKKCFQINCIQHIIQHIIYLSSVLSISPLRKHFRFFQADVLSGELCSFPNSGS